MRDWFRLNVEQPLNRLPVNWDVVFLVSWVLFALGVILFGVQR